MCVATDPGDADGGGDCSAVVRLHDVQQIQATDSTFAAILGDGSVLAWQNTRDGGDSTAAQDQLQNVRQTQGFDTNGSASSRRAGQRTSSGNCNSSVSTSSTGGRAAWAGAGGAPPAELAASGSRSRRGTNTSRTVRHGHSQKRRN